MNNTLYITVGLPGSGKSTYAKEFIKGKNKYIINDILYLAKVIRVDHEKNYYDLSFRRV